MHTHAAFSALQDATTAQQQTGLSYAMLDLSSSGDAQRQLFAVDWNEVIYSKPDIPRAIKVRSHTSISDYTEFSTVWPVIFGGAQFS